MIKYNKPMCKNKINHDAIELLSKQIAAQIPVAAIANNKYN